MKHRFRRLAGLLFGSSLSLFAGCSDNDEPSAEGTDQGAVCEVIGELCHEVESAAAQECHESAHHGHCAFASCVKLCVPDADEGADPRCAALGELCHPVADQSDALRECHELGHANDSASCAAAFDDCAASCISAREALEAEPSGGGAGGSGADGEHALGGAGGSDHHD